MMLHLALRCTAGIGFRQPRTHSSSHSSPAAVAVAVAVAVGIAVAGGVHSRSTHCYSSCNSQYTIP